MRRLFRLKFSFRAVIVAITKQQNVGLPQENEEIGKESGTGSDATQSNKANHSERSPYGAIYRPPAVRY